MTNRPPAFGQGTDIPITGKVIDALRTTGVTGYVPVVDITTDDKGQLQPVPKLRPWWDDPIWRNRDTGATGWHPSYRPGNTFPIPAAAQQRILDRTPPEVRTSAREKYSALQRLLRAEARRFTQADGTVEWPASVQAELKEAAWKAGKAGKLDVDEQVELLARNYIVHSANKQKENDQKKITTSWHGHYTA